MSGPPRPWNACGATSRHSISGLYIQLETHGPKRERLGNRLEGLLADRDPDHQRFSAAFMRPAICLSSGLVRF
jgi:hypothetical protein